MTDSGLIGFDFKVLTAKVCGQECPFYASGTVLAAKSKLGSWMQILPGTATYRHLLGLTQRTA
jgi:hypothetical protein